MSNINNQWVRENQSRLYRLLREIEEYAMKGSYGGELNLHQIRVFIEQMFKEVNALQNKLDLKDVEIKNLNAKITEMNTKLAGVSNENPV